MDQWGDKWTFIILRDLLAGSKKFSGFLESAEPLPTNLLSNRLARLVEEGYVVKTQYQDRPKRFEYAMTGAGRSLVPVMQAMVEWANAHVDDLGNAPEGIKAARAKVRSKAKPKPTPAPAVSQGAFDF